MESEPKWFTVSIEDSTGDLTKRTCEDVETAFALAIDVHSGYRRSHLLASLVRDDIIEFEDSLPSELVDNFTAAAGKILEWWDAFDDDLNRRALELRKRLANGEYVIPPSAT